MNNVFVNNPVTSLKHQSIWFLMLNDGYLSPSMPRVEFRILLHWIVHCLFNSYKTMVQCHNLMNSSRGLNLSKNRFQLSAGLNLAKSNTILSGINHFEPRLKFKPRLKFFKFGLSLLFHLFVFTTPLKLYRVTHKGIECNFKDVSMDFFQSFLHIYCKLAIFSMSNHLVYHITTKVWDFRDDCTNVLVCFLAFRVPCRPKLAYFSA